MNHVLQNFGIKYNFFNAVVYYTFFLSIHFFLCDCSLEYCLWLHLEYLGKCVANSCLFVIWSSRDFHIWTSVSPSVSQLLQHQNRWFPIGLIQSLIIRQFFLCDNGLSLALMFFTKCHRSNLCATSGSSSLVHLAICLFLSVAITLIV